jgi:hypothetical protein
MPRPLPLHTVRPLELIGGFSAPQITCIVRNELRCHPAYLIIVLLLCAAAFTVDGLLARRLAGHVFALNVGIRSIDQTVNEHGTLQSLVAKTPRSRSHRPRPEPSCPVT